jgi:hypothetical protein
MIRAALLAALFSLTMIFIRDASAETISPPLRVYLPLMIRLSEDAPLPPDLTTTWVYANMRGFNGGCIPRYEPLVLKVCVRNLGAGAAGPFDIGVENQLGARSSGLAPGGSECLETIEMTYGVDPITAVVDWNDEVAESDEANNAWTGRAPLPTPPLLCAPTPTVTPLPAQTGGRD